MRRRSRPSSSTVGDFNFALGIFAVFDDGHGRLRHRARRRRPCRQDHPFPNWDWASLICILLFIGAMGKSAQFLLHTWLPTPWRPTSASALIHAATMVTAGVFMVARLSPLFELAPNAGLRDLHRGDDGVLRRHRWSAQNDIKHRRLFDLFPARLHVRRHGVGAYSVGMFHLFRLLQGAVVPRLRLGDHGTHYEQDIRMMGGLRTASRSPTGRW